MRVSDEMLLALLILKEEAARRVETASSLPAAASAVRSIDVERLVNG